MATTPKLEERSFRTVEAVRAALDAAMKYNDFGSVLGAQDEASEIYETLMSDLGRAATRARRLSQRIRKWNEGERDVPLL